jgi:hypothetical protein
MTLLNELQNAIAAVSVVQTLTSKTAKDFEFGSLKPMEYTPTIHLPLRTIQPTSTDSERVFSEAGNFKTKIRSRMKLNWMTEVHACSLF